MNWTMKDIPFIHHDQIIEWDIKSANTSIMRYYKLAPEKTIIKFEEMKKADREVAVGLYMKRHPDFSKELEHCFNNIIKEFIEANKLNKDEDIISIKKDAVFVKSKNVKITKFGDSVNFIRKGIYTGVLIIPPYEFYYSDKVLDVKGISDISLKLHEDGMLSFIRAVFKYSNNWLELNKFLKEYIKVYKSRELPFDAYREFNSESKFKIILDGNELSMTDIDEDILNDTNIIFNYTKIILPTLRATAR